MNPEIDLTGFRRPGTVKAEPARTHASAAVAVPRELVSPPRRLLTRYVLPTLLLLAFAGVLLYSFRKSFVRPVGVRVAMPVVLAGTGIPSHSEAPAAATTHHPSAETPAAAAESAAPAGDPLFQAPGWVEPAPYPFYATAQTMGVLETVEVLEGEAVAHGQVIARLVDGDARLAVQQAEATLELRRAEAEAAQAAWENPTGLVEAIQTTEAEGERLKAEKSRYEQMALLSEKEARRSETLRRSGVEATFATERTMTQAETSRLSARETAARIAANEAALKAARERLRLRLEDRERLNVARARLHEAEAALADARYRLSQRTVLAPTTGVVMRLLASPGSMLSPDMPDGMGIASLYNPEQLQVRADVPLANAGQVRPGMKVAIRCEALPETTFAGEVVRIVHEADVQRNTLPVKVRILRPDPALKPEMIARLQFFPEPSRNEEKGKDMEESLVSAPRPGNSGAGDSLWIPAEALPAGSTGPEVTLWRATASGKAEPQQVTLSDASRDGLREVRSGLTPADKIILNPPANLAPGTPIRILEGA